MNLFGAVLLGILLYIIIKGKKKDISDVYLDVFSLTMITNTFINLGYFLKIKNATILYSDFLVVILFIFSIFIFITRGKINKQFGYGLFFSLTIIVGLISCIIIPVNFVVLSPLESWDDFIFGNVNKSAISIGIYSIKKILNVFMYLTSILAFTTIITENKFKRLITRFYKATLIFTGLYILEFIIGSLHSNLFRDFANFVFGRGDSTYFDIHFKNGMIRMCGLTREPSHFVKSIFLSTSILLFLKKYIINFDRRSFNMLLILNLFFLLFSMSMSSLIFLIILTYILTFTKIFKSTKFSKKTLILLLFITISIVSIAGFGYFMYGDRVNEIIKIITSDNPIYNGANGSEIARLSSIKEAFKIFLVRPLFGGGLGTTDGHSFTAVILSNVGLVGLTLWFLFVKGNMTFNFNVRKIIILLGVAFLLIFVSSIADMYSLTMYIAILGLLTHLQDNIV